MAGGRKAARSDSGADCHEDTKPKQTDSGFAAPSCFVASVPIPGLGSVLPASPRTLS